MSSQPSIVNIDMKKKSDGDRARKIVFRNEKKKENKKKGKRIVTHLWWFRKVGKISSKRRVKGSLLAYFVANMCSKMARNERKAWKWVGKGPKKWNVKENGESGKMVWFPWREEEKRLCLLVTYLSSQWRQKIHDEGETEW